MAIEFQIISARLTRIIRDGEKVGYIDKIEPGLYEVAKLGTERGEAPLAHEATRKAAEKAARMHFA